MDHVGQRIRSHMANPILVHRLIFFLPSSTMASHGFKRRLGLASFMKSNAYLTNDLDDISTMKSLIRYLHENKSFKIRDDTDFYKLGARFGTLDVAMGAGLSGFEFCTSDRTIQSEDRQAREGEGDFNSALDDVVKELRSVAFNIRDSGAAHIRRTECKTAIEKLSYRLEFAARTRPKAKQGLFGLANGASDMMETFVARRE
jgi:hypothetical protein